LHATAPCADDRRDRRHPARGEPCDPSLDCRPIRDHLGIAVLVVGAKPGDAFVVWEWQQRKLRLGRGASAATEGS
jgi:hypothetical protein